MVALRSSVLLLFTNLALVFTLVALAACSNGPAAPSAGEDVRELGRFLDAVHPRPYRFTPKASFQALVEQEADRLDELTAPPRMGPPGMQPPGMPPPGMAPPSIDPLELELQTALAFHRVLAAVGDGHLAVALPVFQPSAPEQPLLAVLPKRIGDKIYLDSFRSPTDDDVIELLDIDGVPMAQIYDTLEKLVLVDANAPIARRAAVERNFARYYHVAYGFRPSYQVRVRVGEQPPTIIPFAGATRAALARFYAERRSAPLAGPPPADPTAPWPFLQAVDNQTQLLRLPSFAVADQAEYARRVDGLFTLIPRNTTRLILDVRGNQGGLRTHGVAVLNNIVTSNYMQWSQMAARVLRVPDAFRDRISFPYVPEAALAERFAGAPKQDDRYLFKGDPLVSMMRPNGSGGVPYRVFVFVSAAVEMVVALRAARPNTFVIGEETATECGGHVGELPLQYTAETTGLAVLVSLIEITHVATTGCRPGHGVEPDVKISYDLATFSNYRDPYLAAAAAVPR